MKKHQSWVVLLVLQPKLISTIIKTYHSILRDPQVAGEFYNFLPPNFFCFRFWIEEWLVQNIQTLKSENVAWEKVSSFKNMNSAVN